MARMPTLYIPHGGGPWPWMPDGPFGGRKVWGGLQDYLSGLPASLPAPKAILCITAHWEASVPTVGGNAAPGMIYDYYGFPPNTYEVVWPAPGAPSVASRVVELLGAAGIDAAVDAERGYDHGTFVPLAVAWPEASVPVAQMSLKRGLDPKQHLAIGRALAPLRDEGVLILGSGMSYHDLRGYRTPRGAEDAAAFDAWLQHAVTQPREARDDALWAWERAPSARASHPREEHLLPLMVVAGAAGDDVGTVPWSEPVLGTKVSAVRFG